MTGHGTDVLVVGAGAMGAWTALAAKRSGHRVVLIDAFGPGNSRATSGDETRILRFSHGTDTFYPAWARAARDDWTDLGDQVGERLFQQSGALWFVHDEGGFETDSLAALASLAIPVERLEPDEVRARWGGIATHDLAFAVFEPEAGLLLARRGVVAVATMFEREGGAAERGEARPGRGHGDRLLDVLLGDGRRLAGDAFVFACGPWLPRLFAGELSALIRVTRQDVAYFGLPPGDRRFEAPAFPCWVDNSTGAYGIGSVDGRGFKCASDTNGPQWDPSSGDRLVDAAAIDEARAYLARRFPPLAAAPVSETRVCQYESTPDAEFVIDRHPRWRNVWLVGGGSGHGFKHGPVIGRYVAERLGTDDSVDPRFRLDRPLDPRSASFRPGAAAVSSPVR